MSSAKPTGGKSSATPKETAKTTAAKTTTAKTTTAKTTAAKRTPAKRTPAKTTSTRTTKGTSAKAAGAKATAVKAKATTAETPMGATADYATRRQQKTGKVVSNKMEKTIVVAVESLKRHRLYKRTYKSTTRFKAHDEHNEALPGDLVRIEETRPISKDKRWRLVAITQRAVQAPSVEQVVAQLDPEAEGR